MHAELQAQVAFYLTGKRAGQDLVPIEGLNLRPALFAGYRDLTGLRYDYPLVLARDPGDGAAFESISASIDRALDEIGADGSEGERLRAHAWKLEQGMRTMAAASASGSLGELLDRVAQRLAPAADAPLRASAGRLRAALQTDGEVTDCNVAAPARVLIHAWETVQRGKAEAFRALLERLILKLGDILRADHARSSAGRTAESLRASVGKTDADAIDFEAMSRILASVSPKSALSAPRRRRIELALTTLASQRFFAAAGAQRFAFRFESCAVALAAWRERCAEMIDVARAVAVAELEVKGDYNEARHDPWFEQFGLAGLDPRDTALFPDYLVCANCRDMHADEHDRLMEILSRGLPMKVLVQCDDLIEPPSGATDHFGVGARSRQLASAAIGLHEVYVLQSSASHLVRFRDCVMHALRYPGPALVSVFSGASGQCGDLPAYLVAAAAMESRAFPGFVYDPSAGPDWASRFALDANPQPDRDWSQQRLSFEDAAHQRVVQEVEFTLVDFLACDRRYAKHFAKVPQEKWNGSLAPVAACLAEEGKGLPEKLPTLLMADREDVLHKVIADDRLLREARRCRDAWRSLQELGGIHNSHAERLVARERQEWEAARKAEATAAVTPAPAAAEPASLAAAAPTVEPEKARPSDEPYIETERCSTCNECINLNDRMFAYDENQQARIVDPDAGTYRQLVEAAESCQVAVIHPGKPKNPDEPGLDELLKRAEPFL